MLNLRDALYAATVKWRRTAQNTRRTALDALDPLEVGHMHGMSDGLDLAADDIDALLTESTPPLNGDQ